MNLNDIGKRAYDNCVRVGFRGSDVSDPTPLEIHALIHSEISEATEEIRNNKPAIYVIDKDGHEITTAGFQFKSASELFDYHPDAKPEGEAVEFADALIRILETAYVKGWNMDAIVAAKMDYNETRPYKHGGKKL